MKSNTTEKEFLCESTQQLGKKYDLQCHAVVDFLCMCHQKLDWMPGVKAHVLLPSLLAFPEDKRLYGKSRKIISYIVKFELL